MHISFYLVWLPIKNVSFINSIWIFFGHLLIRYTTRNMVIRLLTLTKTSFWDIRLQTTFELCTFMRTFFSSNLCIQSLIVKLTIVDSVFSWFNELCLWKYIDIHALRSLSNVQMPWKNVTRSFAYGDGDEYGYGFITMYFAFILLSLASGAGI